jgi:hypothetical protein
VDVVQREERECSQQASKPHTDSDWARQAVAREAVLSASPPRSFAPGCADRGPPPYDCGSPFSTLDSARRRFRAGQPFARHPEQGLRKERPFRPPLTFRISRRSYDHRDTRSGKRNTPTLSTRTGRFPLERVVNLTEKPHQHADSTVGSLHHQSPVFRIRKPSLSKFITASKELLAVFSRFHIAVIRCTADIQGLTDIRNGQGCISRHISKHLQLFE